MLTPANFSFFRQLISKKTLADLAVLAFFAHRRASYTQLMRVATCNLPQPHQLTLTVTCTLPTPLQCCVAK